MVDTITPTSPLVAPTSRPGLLDRLRERRRLHRIDLLGARLARLDAVAELLQRTGTRLAAGWTQDAWFVTVDDRGERHHVGVLQPGEGLVSDRACLVAALAVEALPGTISGPDAQRAISTLWHTLHGDPPAAADWSVAPGLNAARARDLVHWNDARGRAQGDVLALVQASTTAAHTESSRLRAALATA
jgi:hypothetical protein